MIDLPGSGTGKAPRVPARGFNKPTSANCRLATLTILLVASLSHAEFVLETATLNAQEWVPRTAVGAGNTEPIAQASGPTHLVIQAPTPTKHNRSAHHGVSLPQAIVNEDEMLIEGEFGPGESAVAAPPKKKIDLTHAIPSHALKTPRSIAIPDAPRTTGWKQPYSYGHFGAKHNRQLSIHHGHQRAYTQWTFR